jgi:hypothetical protein
MGKLVHQKFQYGNILLFGNPDDPKQQKRSDANWSLLLLRRTTVVALRPYALLPDGLPACQPSCI